MNACVECSRAPKASGRKCFTQDVPFALAFAEARLAGIRLLAWLFHLPEVQ
jgi:hypothetical protein